ncbi:hypothetical protein ACG7TL_004752 [Trametes sanguinea]
MSAPLPSPSTGTDIPMGGLRRLDDDVLLRIYQELRPRHGLQPLSLTCKWIRESVKPVLFSSCHQGALALTWEDFIPRQLWPYIRDLVLFGVWAQSYPPYNHRPGVPFPLRQVLSEMPQLTNVSIVGTLNRGVPLTAQVAVLSHPHLRTFDIDGHLYATHSLVEVPTFTAAPLACYRQVVPDFRQARYSPPESLFLCLVINQPQVQKSLEILEVPSEFVPLVLIAERHWPHLKRVALRGENWEYDRPVVDILNQMPALHELVLTLGHPKTSPLHRLCPPGWTGPLPWPELKTLCLTYPDPTDPVYTWLPTTLRHLVLSCWPRHYNFQSWELRLKLDNIGWDSPIQDSSAILNILSRCRCPQLDSLHIEFVGSGSDLELFRLIARAFPDLSSLTVFRYRPRQTTNVPVGLRQKLPRELSNEVGATDRHEEDIFQMVLDTASNTTWVLGRGYREFIDPSVEEQTVDADAGVLRPQLSQPEPPSQSPPVPVPQPQSQSQSQSQSQPRSQPQPLEPQPPTQPQSGSEPQPQSQQVQPKSFILQPWKEEDARDDLYDVDRPCHTKLLNPVYVPSGSAEQPVHMPSNAVYLQAQYADRTVACLCLEPKAEHFRIKNCFNWTPDRRQRVKLKVRMHFSSAFGVSYWLDRGVQDGALGLGLSDLQNDFRPLNVTSFLGMLKHKIRRSSSAQEFAYLIMYLALRSPLASVRENWLAWNKWPTTNPRWCKPITVMPYRYLAHLGAQAYMYWIVPLTGMKLVRRLGGGNYEDVPNGDLWRVWRDQSPKTTASEAEVLLDTENQILGESTDGPPFVVPNALWRSSYYMEYHFRGTGADETIVVRTEAERFLCAWNPYVPNPSHREGLVCALGKSGLLRVTDEYLWIFGVNFFHTMYVAMAKPRNSSEDAYVQLAPQRDSETNNYLLPVKE